LCELLLLFIGEKSRIRALRNFIFLLHQINELWTPVFTPDGMSAAHWEQHLASAVQEVGVLTRWFKYDADFLNPKRQAA
jgi:hypothetical protein